MAVRPSVLVRYRPVRTSTAAQRGWIGAQEELYQRGWWHEAPTGTSITITTNPRQRMLCRFGGLVAAITASASIGGQTRAAGFAAFDPTTGAVSAAFNPTFGGGNPECLATDGTYLYIGGSFDTVNGASTINGLPVRGLCRLDYTGALDTTWNPYVHHSSASTLILCLEHNRDRASLYVGGTFELANVTTRNNVCEVLTSDATPTAWNPNADDSVLVVRYDADRSLVYVGGIFLNIAATTNDRLVRLAAGETATLDTTWLPQPDAEVLDVLLDGQQVYTCGAFANIGNTPAARAFVACLDQRGQVTSWNPIPNARVVSLGVYRDTIFLAGDFTLIGATARTGLAAVLTSPIATVLAWNPAPADDVQGILVVDRTVYATGLFLSISTSANKLLAAVPYPIFTDANTKYVAKTGSDAAAGTSAAPYLTIAFALAQLAGAFTFAVVKDSESYDEQLTVAYSANEAGGLFAADGEAPTVEIRRGAAAGTYGARVSGRTKFSTGLAATFSYVSKQGSNVTGLRGDRTKPFLTIQAALTNVLRLANDTIQIEDSERYREDLTADIRPVTIQAADGQVPVLVTAGAAVHLTAAAAVALNLYGLTFDDDLQNAISAVRIVQITGNLEAYDCSFYRRAVQLDLLGGAVLTLTVVNCLFSQASSTAIFGPTGASVVTVTNCRFYRSTSIAFSSNAAMQVAVLRCSFIDPSSSNNGTSADFAGTGSHVLSVTSCIFQDTRTTPEGVTAIFNRNSSAAAALAVTNTLFERIGGNAIDFLTNGPLVTISGCAVVNFSNQSVATTGDIRLRRDSTITNLVSIGARYSAVEVVAGTTTMTGAALINAGTHGAIDVMTATRVAEFGSGSSSFVGTTATFCVLATAQSGGGQVFPSWRGDPMFLSVAEGSESVAYSAASQALGNGVGGLNIGISNPTISVTSAARAFSIDGITIDGDPYFNDGVLTAHGMASPVYVSWCSFRRLAVQAVGLNSGSVAERCLFDGVSGVAIQVFDGGSQVRQCVGQRCAGAFLVVLGSVAAIERNSSYGCEYGQYDVAGAPDRLLRDNVYAGSGAFDYRGEGEQANSCIPNLDGSATVSDGSRRDPLYRDAQAPDLRLQVTEAGYPYDSPAKGLAHDGSDAGAYDFAYPPRVTTWTTLDFESLGYNPDNITTGSDPIKMVEGDTFGLITYSDAPGFKNRIVMDWGPKNPMPAAQVAALEDLYTAGDGECQVSVDGGAMYTPCHVLRSVPFTRTQLQGLFYSRDEVPEPVRSLSFRVST